MTFYLITFNCIKYLIQDLKKMIGILYIDYIVLISLIVPWNETNIPKGHTKKEINACRASSNAQLASYNPQI